MNRKKIIQLFELLQKNISGNIKFNYWLAKTRTKLKGEIEAIKEAIKYDDDFIKYQNERIALCEKYAKKDKEGNPIIKNNNFIIDNEEDFEKEIEALKQKYSETIKKAEERTKEIEQFLETTTDTQIPQININDIPDNAFSPEEIELLIELNIITENPE